MFRVTGGDTGHCLEFQFYTRSNSGNFSFVINCPINIFVPSYGSIPCIDMGTGDTVWPPLASKIPSAVCCVVDMELCYSCVPVVEPADSPEAVLVFSEQDLSSINGNF